MELQALARRAISQGHRRRFIFEKIALLLPPITFVAPRRCAEKSPEVWSTQKHPPTSHASVCTSDCVEFLDLLSTKFGFCAPRSFLQEANFQLLHPFGIEPSAILHESLVPKARQQYRMHAHK